MAYPFFSFLAVGITTKANHCFQPAVYFIGQRCKTVNTVGYVLVPAERGQCIRVIHYCKHTGIPVDNLSILVENIFHLMQVNTARSINEGEYRVEAGCREFRTAFTFLIGVIQFSIKSQVLDDFTTGTNGEVCLIQLVVGNNTFTRCVGHTYTIIHLAGRTCHVERVTPGRTCIHKIRVVIVFGFHSTGLSSPVGNNSSHFRSPGVTGGGNVCSVRTLTKFILEFRLNHHILKSEVTIVGNFGFASLSLFRSNEDYTITTT